MAVETTDLMPLTSCPLTSCRPPYLTDLRRAEQALLAAELSTTPPIATSRPPCGDAYGCHRARRQGATASQQRPSRRVAGARSSRTEFGEWRRSSPRTPEAPPRTGRGDGAGERARGRRPAARRPGLPRPRRAPSRRGVAPSPARGTGRHMIPFVHLRVRRATRCSTGRRTRRRSWPALPSSASTHSASPTGTACTGDPVREGVPRLRHRP